MKITSSSTKRKSLSLTLRRRYSNLSATLRKRLWTLTYTTLGLRKEMRRRSFCILEIMLLIFLFQTLSNSCRKTVSLLYLCSKFSVLSFGCLMNIGIILCSLLQCSCLLRRQWSFKDLRTCRDFEQ